MPVATRASEPATTVLANPLRDPEFVSEAAVSPRWYHQRLPGYSVTPLHDLGGLAAELGIGRLLVKDESLRLGLPAFKMLGASWAVYRTLCDRLGREPAGWAGIEELRQAFAPLLPLTLVTATDGNHGRAVARIAAMLNLRSRIWVPANTVASRIEAIEQEGAAVVISAGGYDQAVAEAAAAADTRTLVISDTSWPGYEAIPRWVFAGYTTILEEIDEQLAAAGLPPPDAVVVPVGVGALAAAVAMHYRRRPGDTTRLVGAEPVDAACVLESAKAGEITTLDGPQLSIMAGLNCGTPSAVAWPAVSRGFDFFVTATDAEALAAMRALAREGIESGESGAAPLAALKTLLASGKGALNANSSVVLISTEGITDPEFYAREVGDGRD